MGFDLPSETGCKLGSPDFWLVFDDEKMELTALVIIFRELEALRAHIIPETILPMPYTSCSFPYV
jgi:hypothetical protein